MTNNPRFHGFVEGATAERPANYQHHRALGVQRKLLNRTGTLLKSCRCEMRSQRIACENNLLSRKETFHVVVGNANRLCSTRQKFIGQSGIGVLLLNECRYAKLLCSPKNRPGCIASKTYDNIGFEGADNLLGATCAPE